MNDSNCTALNHYKLNTLSFCELSCSYCKKINALTDNNKSIAQIKAEIINAKKQNHRYILLSCNTVLSPILEEILKCIQQYNLRAVLQLHTKLAEEKISAITEIATNKHIKIQFIIDSERDLNLEIFKRIDSQFEVLEYTIICRKQINIEKIIESLADEAISRLSFHFPSPTKIVSEFYTCDEIYELQAKLKQKFPLLKMHASQFFFEPKLLKNKELYRQSLDENIYHNFQSQMGQHSILRAYMSLSYKHALLFPLRVPLFAIAFFAWLLFDQRRLFQFCYWQSRKLQVLVKIASNSLLWLLYHIGAEFFGRLYKFILAIYGLGKIIFGYRYIIPVFLQRLQGKIICYSVVFWELLRKIFVYYLYGNLCVCLGQFYRLIVYLQGLSWRSLWRLGYPLRKLMYILQYQLQKESFCYRNFQKAKRVISAK